MRVLNTAQMREADRRTIADLGVPSLVLMEHAGRQVVSALESRWPPRPDRRIAVVCGKGNNGGDGFVAARILAARGAAVRVYLAAPEAEVGGDAKVCLSALREAGVPVADVSDPTSWAAARTDLGACDLVVDALFGTGLTRPVAGRWRSIVADLAAPAPPPRAATSTGRCATANGKPPAVSIDLPSGLSAPAPSVVSIDLPSGLSADTLQPIGEAARADLTVALGAPKVSLLLDPAAARAGDVVVADIGIPAAVIDAVPGPRVTVITRAWARRQVPVRRRESHKGDYGRVLVAAGSTGKAGAAALAAVGALRSGAGLVTVATPRVCQPAVAAFAPEYMTLGLDHDGEGRVAAEAAGAVLAERCDVLAVGPGLGRGDGVARFVRALVDRAPVPLVLDADALNAFAGDPAGLRGRPDRALVVTPHAGEMGHLLGRPAEHVRAQRLDAARDLAVEQGVFVVLKGARTLVAAPTGDVWINVTGNPGMATGGTGDVLAGVLAAWTARLPDVEAACALGVCLHGLAGDLAAAGQGHEGLVAGDLAGQLGPALLALERAEPERHDQEPEHRPL